MIGQLVFKTFSWKILERSLLFSGYNWVNGEKREGSYFGPAAVIGIRIYSLFGSPFSCPVKKNFIWIGTWGTKGTQIPKFCLFGRYIEFFIKYFGSIIIFNEYLKKKTFNYWRWYLWQQKDDQESRYEWGTVTVYIQGRSRKVWWWEIFTCTC